MWDVCENIGCETCVGISSWFIYIKIWNLTANFTFCVTFAYWLNSLWDSVLNYARLLYEFNLCATVDINTNFLLVYRQLTYGLAAATGFLLLVVILLLCCRSKGNKKLSRLVLPCVTSRSVRSFVRSHQYTLIFVLYSINIIHIFSVTWNTLKNWMITTFPAINVLVWWPTKMLSARMKTTSECMVINMYVNRAGLLY